MTVKRMQQTHDFLFDCLDDSFDVELESSLLRLTDKVDKEIAERVIDGRVSSDVFNMSIEIINIYLNVLIMSCFHSTREVASLTRAMLEGGIILSYLLKDQNGKFLEDLEVRRVKSIRAMDNVHAQYDTITPGQIAYLKYDRKQREALVKNGINRVKRGEDLFSQYDKISEMVEEYQEGRFFWLYLTCSNYIHFIEYKTMDDICVHFHHFARELLATLNEDFAQSLNLDITEEFKEFRTILMSRYEAKNYGLEITDFSELIWSFTDFFKEQNIYDGILSGETYSFRISFSGSLRVIPISTQKPHQVIGRSVLDELWNKLRVGSVRIDDIDEEVSRKDMIVTVFSLLPFVKLEDQDGTKFLIADGEKAFLNNMHLRITAVINQNIQDLIKKGTLPLDCPDGCEEEMDIKEANVNKIVMSCPSCNKEQEVPFKEDQ